MEKEHGEGDEGLSGVDHGSDNGARFHGYHDLMRFRVRDILLVASLYDAFILEEDGRLSEQLYGEYKDLDLSSPPRITRVSTPEEAFEELRMRRYDMVVTMTKLVDMDPFKFGKTVKEHQHGIPVILLVTDISDLGRFHNPGHYGSVDKVFFWSGDSALLLAIPKYVEDMVNVGPDTEEGMVGVLLVIENSARYYSMFLSLIYSEIMRQTQSLVSDSLNDHEKLLRRRARPKIILAETFEEGLVKYNLYKEHMLGVITDVTYPRDGKDDEEAGFRFIEAVDTDIPILLQSSHAEHGDRAAKMNVPFLDKRSDTLLQGIRDFFNENLGFGDFVFRMPDGGEAGRASNMAEFIELARKVPVESLRLHAEANSFSNWLMARGEFSLAAKLRPRKLSDFKDEEGMREDLLNAVTESRREKQRGIITDFSQQQFEFEETFTVFGGGSLGGKGRGLAFLNTLLRQGNMRNGLHKCRIRVPDTLVLGADEYDRFIEENGLRDIAKDEPSDKEISRCFSEGELSSDLKSALKNYIQHVRVPVAVRSSSLLEDSQNQPFAGVYSTYLLPNNHGRDGVRLEQLSQAIKLVYASVFYKEARAYIRSTVHKAEEEKMAVVIQKIAGNNFGQRFYPVFSGVAQSYNFYPVPPLTREEGTATVALGLGKIVVEGGKALSFSPGRPKVIPGFSSPEEVLENSQNRFYALSMKKEGFDLMDGEDATLLLLDVSEGAKDNTLEHLASTYDAGDNRLRDGVDPVGPKVITFANILKYETFPLSKILMELLAMGKKGMGRSVEIEFAAALDDDNSFVFNILQIRPLVTMKERNHVAIGEEETKRENAFVSTDKALGNGILDSIRDVIFVLPGKFDPAFTREIAEEIGEFNEMLSEPYMLLGPGRWGTRDRWLGIPVAWDQISRARAIVETSLENFRIDPSQGSHFFHNMTSLGMAYFTVNHASSASFIDWEWIESIPFEEEKRYVRHVRFPQPLRVKVDGRTGQGLISKEKAEGD